MIESITADDNVAVGPPPDAAAPSEVGAGAKNK